MCKKWGNEGGELKQWVGNKAEQKQRQKRFEIVQMFALSFGAFPFEINWKTLSQDTGAVERDGYIYLERDGDRANICSAIHVHLRTQFAKIGADQILMFTNEFIMCWFLAVLPQNIVILNKLWDIPQNK